MEVKFIAELAGLNESAAQGALGDLANRALVLPDQEERHFVLVPMVADFLRRQRPEAVAETGNRLEERAYALIVENGYSKHDRFPVLDANWPTVAPALPLFVAGPNPRLQTVCAALLHSSNFTGRWDEWLSLEQQAEAKAVAAGDHDNAGWRAYQAGSVHYLRGQADMVLACADRAAAHWQTAQSGTRERAIAIQLARPRSPVEERLPRRHRQPTARRSICRAACPPRAGRGHRPERPRRMPSEHSGDLAAAERDYREALRIARAVGYPEGVATYTGNLAALALDRKDWPGAETLAREALTLSEKRGPPGIDRRPTAAASPRPWCGRERPPRPYPTPGARWRSSPGSARPTSKKPARFWRKCEG